MATVGAAVFIRLDGTYATAITFMRTYTRIKSIGMTTGTVRFIGNRPPVRGFEFADMTLITHDADAMIARIGGTAMAIRHATPG